MGYLLTISRLFLTRETGVAISMIAKSSVIQNFGDLWHRHAANAGLVLIAIATAIQNRKLEL